MGFFNDDFYKQLGKDIDVEEDGFSDAFRPGQNNATEDDEDDKETNALIGSDKPMDYYPDNVNLEVNKRNKETFDSLMDNAAQKNDDYWDLNNPIVKWLLMGMFVVIVIGIIYYVISWFTVMN